MPVFIVSLPLVGRDQGWGWPYAQDRLSIPRKGRVSTAASGGPTNSLLLLCSLGIAAEYFRLRQCPSIFEFTIGALPE